LAPLDPTNEETSKKEINYEELKQELFRDKINNMKVWYKDINELKLLKERSFEKYCYI